MTRYVDAPMETHRSPGAKKRAAKRSQRQSSLSAAQASPVKVTHADPAALLGIMARDKGEPFVAPPGKVEVLTPYTRRQVMDTVARGESKKMNRRYK